MLETADSDRKLLIAELFGNMIVSRKPALPPLERDRMVTALIRALVIPDHALRTRAIQVRLLDRYKRADSPSVKYTAEYESARLTQQPNLPLWIDALSQSGTPFQEMAQRVLAEYVAPKFKAEGVEAVGAERGELVMAALEPDAVDPRLLPARSARRFRHQDRTRRWRCAPVVRQPHRTLNQTGVQ